MTMRARAVFTLLFCAFALSVQAAELSPDAVNNAEWRGSAQDEALLVKTQNSSRPGSLFTGGDRRSDRRKLQEGAGRFC